MAERDEQPRGDWRGVWAMPPWPRAAAAAVVWLVVIGVACIVAAAVWKGDLSRQLIAGVALGVIVVATLVILRQSGAAFLAALFAVLTGIFTVIGVALRVDELLPDGPVPRGALVDCPSPPDHAAFRGGILPNPLHYVRVRTRPSIKSDVVIRYREKGCTTLAFKGYCLGEQSSDAKFGTPDVTWFILESGKGVIAGSQINTPIPPSQLAPSQCPGGNLSPPAPQITAPSNPKLSGQVRFSAAGPDSPMVGFAAYYPNSPGKPKSAAWHRIGLDTATDDGIQVSWDTRAIPEQGQGKATPVTVAAVTCLALAFPTRSQGTRQYVVVNGGGSRRHAPRNQQTLPPSTTSFGQARTEACRNPKA